MSLTAILAAASVVIALAGGVTTLWYRGEYLSADASAAAARLEASRLRADLAAAGEREKAAEAASEAAIAAADVRAAAARTIRTEIIHAPNGTSCAASPPVRALLGGLRRGIAASAGDHRVAQPGGAANLPAPAGRP